MTAFQTYLAVTGGLAALLLAATIHLSPRPKRADEAVATAAGSLACGMLFGGGIFGKLMFMAVMQ